MLVNRVFPRLNLLNATEAVAEVCESYIDNAMYLRLVLKKRSLRLLVKLSLKSYVRTNNAGLRLKVSNKSLTQHITSVL